MKKIYTLIALIMCVSYLSAQNDIWNFENGQVGGWGTFGQLNANLEVVANPSVTGENTSSQVLLHEPTSAWGGIDRYDNTNGVFSAKPEKISFLVYATDIAAADESGLKIKLDIASNTEEFYMANPLTPETWTLVEFDISSLTNWDYIQFALQNHVDGTFYYDDISIIYDVSNSTKAPKAEAKISTAPGTINVAPQMGSNVAIYSLSGAKVFSQDNAGGNLSVNVVPGLYIVVVDNTSKKVVVK